MDDIVSPAWVNPQVNAPTGAHDNRPQRHLLFSVPFLVVATLNEQRWSTFRWRRSAQRPNIVTTYEQTRVSDWNIGPNRFPTSVLNPYLNIGSFAYPAAFTVGNLARNTFIGPGLNSTQLSLAKVFNITEAIEVPNSPGRE